MLNKFEKIIWTITIRMTKSENLTKDQQKHIQIANAYQKEYMRRKKAFLSPDDVR